MYIILENIGCIYSWGVPQPLSHMQHGYWDVLQKPPFIDDFPIQMSIYFGDFPASHVSYRGVCFLSRESIEATGMFWKCGSKVQMFPRNNDWTKEKLENSRHKMDFNNQNGGWGYVIPNFCDFPHLSLGP